MPIVFMVNYLKMRREEKGAVMPMADGRQPAERMEPMERFGPAQGAQLLRFRVWKERFPWLSAGVSTRGGGVSLAPWNSLNCGLHVGDRAEDVVENRRRVAGAAGFAFDKWTCAEQVHGNAVAIVTAERAGAGRRSMADAIGGADALITNVPQVMLCAFIADCAPIMLVDPVRRAVGIAHAGWRGTAGGVTFKTVEAMTNAFGTNPADLFAGIGPSIRGCCYEVDENTASRFLPYAAAGAVNRTLPGRFTLDLAKINRQQLTEAGILPNRIEITTYCTRCRTDLFFSHRGERGRTGRMTAWIGLRE